MATGPGSKKLQKVMIPSQGTTNRLCRIGLKAEHPCACKSSPLKSAKVKGERAALSIPHHTHTHIHRGAPTGGAVVD